MSKEIVGPKPTITFSHTLPLTQVLDLAYRAMASRALAKFGLEHMDRLAVTDPTRASWRDFVREALDNAALCEQFAFDSRPKRRSQETDPVPYVYRIVPSKMIRDHGLRFAEMISHKPILF